MPARHTSTNPAAIKKDVTGYERLVFFSDAVMAIAITLLALEVHLPDTITDPAQLPAALTDEAPALGAYFISFFVIGTFWVGHHRIFTHIKRYDPGLLWINLLFLSLIAILPFPTAILGRFAGNRLAVQLYAITVLLIATARTWIWLHAIRANLTAPNVTRADVLRDMLLGILTMLVFLVSFFIAYYNPDMAMYFWIVLFIVLIVIRRLFP